MQGSRFDVWSLRDLRGALAQMNRERSAVRFEKKRKNVWCKKTKSKQMYEEF
jgi:hypothetical protein